MAEKFLDLKIDGFDGNDHLSIESLKYKAFINKPYFISLHCSYSGNDEIKTEDMVGKNATITISDVNGIEKKYLYGVLTSVHQYNSMNLNDKHAFKHVRIAIKPMLSLMDQHCNTRVFSAGDIVKYVKGIAGDYQINKFEAPVDCQDLIQREFCIQYNESDLNFVKRLLESEGVFYYFQQGEDGCTLKLGSGTGDYCRDEPIKLGTDSDSIRYTSIARGNHIVTGIDMINDYDFTNPSKSLKSANNNKSYSKNVLNNTVVKNYTYPYPVRSFTDPNKKTSKDVGTLISRQRLNSHQSRHETIKLNIPNVWQDFDIGKKININGKSETFVITEYNLTIDAHQGASPTISSKLTAIDTKRRFYPALETPVPHIPPQTAAVIGSENRAIYNKTADNADNNILAKVKFHWDLDPNHTNDSDDCSCWIRVVQAWAGSKRGFIFPPRVGDEVIVTFESGHPDMPMITGSAFNGNNALPYSLDEHKNVSGIVSQTVGKGNSAGRSSAILFKDDDGKEELHFLTKGQQVNVVGKDSLKQVNGSVTELIKKDTNNTVKGDSKIKIDGALSKDIGKTINIKAGDVINIESASQICFNVGGNFITIDQNGITAVGKNVKIDDGGSASPAVPSDPEELQKQNLIALSITD